ncbi:MAG: aldo/keto reductase [Bacteroides sp.]|nr:aldo/keto reductase [Bacteroides sp.]
MSKNINRRDFLKSLGLAGLSLTGIPALANRVDSIAGDGHTEQATSGNGNGSMTYRYHPLTGDKTSLLGFGCMRWPMVDATDGSGRKVVDQQTVNRLVDYAIEHGVNYFDTSPVYLQRQSETAAGIALSRHPRESYHLATKMSNHHLAKSGLKGKELYQASLDMYHQSFERLRTDYFDNYLIHNVGFENRGLSFLKERVFDNHLIDFLLDERRAGRIRNLGFSYHGETKEVLEFLLSLHDDIHWDFAQLKLNYFDYRHAKNVDLTAKQVYDELTLHSIPVIVMEPLLGGKLATLPTALEEKLRQARPQDSIASWAFRFAGSLPNVRTVLSGMTCMEHLQDNLRTYSPLEPCTKNEFSLLESIATELKY